MNTTEIQKRLTKLSAAMADKGVQAPSCEFTARDDGVLNLYVRSPYSSNIFEGNHYRFFRGDTPSDCFNAASDYIAALPSPKDAATHEYLTRVASAIDYATEHSIAEEYVAPLRGVSCAMTDNLLTKETTQ